MTEESGKEVRVQKQSLIASLSIPMAASIDQILRAIQILSDNGGQARMSKIGTSFGTKPSDKNLFSWALNSGIAFDLVMPHRSNAPYVLSEEGKRFRSMKEEQQKAFLLSKFLKFEGYRIILVAMKNSADKSLKKQTITDMWLQIKDNTKKGTRQFYTLTFASVGAWCDALVDSGQSCVLKPDAEKVLEQILKGEEVPQVTETIPVGTKPPTTPPAIPPVVLVVSNCPYCGKTEIGIENEELLNTLSVNGTHILVIKNTYYCKGCSRSFSRIEQRLLKASD